MLRQKLGKFGGDYQEFIGAGIISCAKRYASRLLTEQVEEFFREERHFQHFHNLREKFAIARASYGESVPLIFGSAKLNGKIIWTKKVVQLQERSIITKTSRKYRDHHEHITFRHFLSFAVAICEGEIAEITRVWESGKLVDIGHYQYTLYKGSEEQVADAEIALDMGGEAPAYRDLSYIVFRNLPLDDFGGKVPSFSFEVLRKSNVATEEAQNYLEGQIDSMVLIPGSGEYVYDTQIQRKHVIDQDGDISYSETINMHNSAGIADSVYNLNQLRRTCPNLGWVAPVVCWFGNSLDAGDCLIRPAVEHDDKSVIFDEEWKVSEYDRHSAYQISRDRQGNPNYGGTINDNSLVRYLVELKNRGYKIMLYPMFFLDIAGKPWRGHVSGDTASIHNFFNREDGGYNKMILHYARLTRDITDAFIIGSELIGLTKQRDGDSFPAVSELQNLSRQVKAIVGDRVMVSYAADWSEYHHSEGGWYNMDPLWAEEAIDFIGIDAYFPITNQHASIITDADIMRGFNSGEGYDYYIDDDTGQRHDLAPEYAWKNISYWWHNTHTNPDGNVTDWQPGSKPIWFTEYGFPSIDKSPNQPNIFYDPRSIDGGVPRYSSGQVDFAIQRRAIKCFLEFWRQEEYVANMFLWTWDARPYPAWPHMHYWGDENLWQKGHWVNNKLGDTPLALVLQELTARANIAVDDIDLSQIDVSADSIIFNKQCSMLAAINSLRVAYFFDLITDISGAIKIIKRGKEATGYNYTQDLNHLELIMLDDKKNYVTTKKILSQSMLGKLDLYFYDIAKSYQPSYLHLNSEIGSHNQQNIRLPLAIDEVNAEIIGQKILQNSLDETMLIEFRLPLEYLHLAPSDFLRLEYLGSHFNIRLKQVVLSGLQIDIIGVVDNISSYFRSFTPAIAGINYHRQIPSSFEFMAFQLPQQLSGRNNIALAICTNGNSGRPLYGSSSNDEEGTNWQFLMQVTPHNNIFTVLEFNQAEERDRLFIDELSYIIIKSDINLLEKLTADSWHIAKCGHEFIRFQQIEDIGDGCYLLSYLVRQEYASRCYQAGGLHTNKAIIIDIGYNILTLEDEYASSNIALKVANSICNIECKAPEGEAEVELISVEIDDWGIWLSWRLMSQSADYWQQGVRDEDYQFNITLEVADQQQEYQASGFSYVIAREQIDFELINIEDVRIRVSLA